jgi:hypothetical protein
MTMTTARVTVGDNWIAKEVAWKKTFLLHVLVDGTAL